MPAQANHPKKQHTKLILSLFLIIIFGPALFAAMLVYKGNTQNLHLTHRGDLIKPMPNIKKSPLYDRIEQQTISGETLLGKWSVLYLSPKQCQEHCHDMLYNLKQIRTALGKNAPRVDLVFSPYADFPEALAEYFQEQYPELKQMDIPTDTFEHLFMPISHALDREMLGEVYIIDPKGNVMMHYGQANTPQDVLADLKRLLRVSKIG